MEKICKLKLKQHDLPNGNIPKRFVQLLANEIDELSQLKYPSETV